MSLATTLHDVAPTRLRGLAFLSLAESGQVLRRTIASSAGTVVVGGTWDETGSVYTEGAVTGTAGSYTGSYLETFTEQPAVPCRVDPVGGGEASVAGRIDERTTHRITVPPQTVVNARDRFKMTAGTYEITAVRQRTDGPVTILEAVEDF